MELLLNTPELLVLKTDNNQPLLNAIRRSLYEIETLAIDEVEFFKNDSALYDEMLALRLGLVPLVSEKKMSSKTEVELKLVKKGPGAVYSGDLVGSASVVYDKIPLVLLEEGQEIELVATGRLGKGVSHAKHIPGLCYYRHLLLVRSKNSEVESLIKNSKGLIKPQKHGEGWICDLPEGVVEEVNRIDKEAISETEEIVFAIESYGSMSASEILINAVEALGHNLKELEGQLK